jgi:hypothetical protein
MAGADGSAAGGTGGFDAGADGVAGAGGTGGLDANYDKNMAGAMAGAGGSDAGADAYDAYVATSDANADAADADGPVTDATAPDAGGDADLGSASCPLPANPALPTTDQHVTGAMPADYTGGTLVAGTYYRTQLTKYSDTAAYTADQRQSTLVLDSAGSFTIVDVDLSSSSEPILWGHGTYATDSTMLNANFACPQTGLVQWPYTTTGATLTIYDTTNKRIGVYTKLAVD